MFESRGGRTGGQATRTTLQRLAPVSATEPVPAVDRFDAFRPLRRARARRAAARPSSSTPFRPPVAQPNDGAVCAALRAVAPLAVSCSPAARRAMRAMPAMPCELASPAPRSHSPFSHPLLPPSSSPLAVSREPYHMYHPSFSHGANPTLCPSAFLPLRACRCLQAPPLHGSWHQQPNRTAWTRYRSIMTPS